MGAKGTPSQAAWKATAEAHREGWVTAERQAESHRWSNRGKLDLVLAGGGVKGIAHVGAIKALQDAGYQSHPRIAGTSVGAIVGGLLAIGWTPCEIWEELYRYDFSLMSDTRRLSVTVGGHEFELPSLGPVDQLLGLRQRRGSHVGKAATTWMADVFSRPAPDGTPRPQTFGELWDLHGVTEASRSPLVVMATDVKLGRTVMFPRDYEPVYGLDPREQLIVTAVRASMSIPLYFEPYKMKPSYGVDAATGKPRPAPAKHHPGGDLRTSEFIDGGVLANFAVDALDDGKFGHLHPRWPTFGITLMRDESPKAVGSNLRENTVDVWSLDDAVLGPKLEHFTDGMIGTLVVGQDTAASDHWWMRRRTIRIQTEPIGIVDFDLTPTQKQTLFKRGYDSAVDFLEHTWPGPGGHVGFDGRAEYPLPKPPTTIVPCEHTR